MTTSSRRRAIRRYVACRRAGLPSPRSRDTPTGTSCPTGSSLASRRPTSSGRPSSSHPFGAHIAVVEIDRDGAGGHGARLVSVDDCGVRVSPVLVAGQVHGRPGAGHRPGAARGELVYASGRPARSTAPCMDYARAARGRPAVASSPTDRHADAGKPAGRQGHRRSGDDRLDAGGGQRRRRRAEVVQHPAHRHAPPAGAGVAGHAQWRAPERRFWVPARGARWAWVTGAKAGAPAGRSRLRSPTPAPTWSQRPQAGSVTAGDRLAREVEARCGASGSRPADGRHHLRRDPGAGCGCRGSASGRIDVWAKQRGRVHRSSRAARPNGWTSLESGWRPWCG